MTELEKLKITAFDVIRYEVRDFERTTTDSEVGHYVRGVLDLFCELRVDKSTGQNGYNELKALIDKHRMYRLAYDELSDFERDVLELAEMGREE